MKICLNMIVKNEAGRITRALESCVQFIDCYAIVDTGSTDNTKEIITSFFDAHGIQGKIIDSPFADWSQARNTALSVMREHRNRWGWDWGLLMDADMEIVIKDLPRFNRQLEQGGLSLDMEQRAGTLHYLNRRLIHRDAIGWYRGVTHEYLDVASAGAVPNDVAYFIDHADGANRPDKYRRDIALLLKGLAAEPNNERYYFYLAQSYRDAGDPLKAIEWYRKRVDAGGWDEEVWNAQVNLAHCMKDLNKEAEFVHEMLKAYNMRPSRAESLYDLARYFRDKEGKQATAALFAEVGMAIPRSGDALFVNDYVYKWGMKEEFGITGFYVPHQRARAYATTDHLSQAAGEWSHIREGARQNLYFYMEKLGDLCPSFEWQHIDFKPPANWVALNPSVTTFGGDLRVIVRTVNYRIDEHGRYLIRNETGEVNDHNPINTRNYLVTLNADLETLPNSAFEIKAPADLPVKYPYVIGFEDMRLFQWGTDLWTSATVRQLHEDGNCEQVLSRLQPRENERILDIVDIRRMLRTPRETEKNWSPIVAGEFLSFMWRPGVRVSPEGTIVQNTPPDGMVTDNISGSSQLVPALGGWLALVHSARQIPGSPCRYYYHRFAYYDKDFKLAALSKPFVFHDKVIEFAAGLCVHPKEKNTLVFSYGVKDCEARIGTVNIADVGRLLFSR